MGSVLQTLLALAAAGTMMVSTSLDAAAPQNDIDGHLFLVNRQWRVSKLYAPEVRQADVPGQVRNMRPDAAQALEEMYADAKENDKLKLTSVSGYRSYSKQENIYNNKLNRVGSKEKADEYVARPGASEHQLGLAMDVGEKGKTNLTEAFANYGGGKWIRENSWKYGFILRYDREWEEITGYKFEPWHVRYVGKEYAEMLHEQNIPLETFLLGLREETLLGIIDGEE